MSYNLLKPVTILSAKSLAADFSSTIVEIRNQDNVGIQLNWTTADAIGTFGVEISSDHLEDMEGNVQVAGHWVALPLSPAITTAGINDDAYIDLNQMSAQYIRVTYTATSGTGSVTGIIVAKGV